MKPFAGKRILTAFLNRALLSIILLSAALCLTAGSPRDEESDPELTARGYNVNQLETHIVLRGEQILAGQGIAVIYPPQGPADSSGYVPFQYQCTAAGCFQCLEFILWLYETRLGYPHQWPGSIWNPYQLIGVVQIADQLAYQVETGLLSPENAQFLLYQNYTDLEYFPNPGAQPPQPGDILITADGGHAMVVNRAGGGDQIEVVQQNNWEIKPDPLPLPLENRQLLFDGAVYSVQNSLGWIHSPRWTGLFFRQSESAAEADTLGWTRGSASLTLQIGAAEIEKLAEGLQSAAPYQLARRLAQAGALALTNADYVTCMLRRLAELLQGQPDLGAAGGVSALAVRIPYLSGALEITPNGGARSSTALDFDVQACAWGG